jgi:uncharacterized membrane protein YphA (DoxX/SURF4 family)
MSDQASTVRHAGIVNTVLWIVRILLAAEFFYSGYLLFTGGSTVRTFDAIGVGQWLRYLTGVLEVAGAVGLLVARLAGLAALGLLGVMIGAAATEMFILDNGKPVIPLLLVVGCAVVAWFRRGSIKALLRST